LDNLEKEIEAVKKGIPYVNSPPIINQAPVNKPTQPSQPSQPPKLVPKKA